MACKAYRDLAYAKGISNPQMILPTTAHTAFDKAAQYLGISVVTIPVSSETFTVDVDAVKRAIGRRTCLVSYYITITVIDQNCYLFTVQWI